MARRLLFLTLLCVIIVAAIQLTAGIREMAAKAGYPADGERFEFDGMKIHTEVFGTGPDLVLIHGASGNTRDFTFDLVAKLSDRYRVIVIDRPGLGHSTQPEGYGGIFNDAGESPRLMAKILKKAADQVGVENPIVLGHSLGGAVAMAWALEFPEDTAGLVVLSGATHPWPGELDWLYRVNSHPAGSAVFVPLLTAFTPHGYVDSVVETLFAPQGVPDGYLEHVGAGLTLRRSSLRANARQVSVLRENLVEMAEYYPTLTLPIEALHGDADTIVGLDIHSKPLAERIASVNLGVLEGAGHMPHHTHQNAVISAIDRVAERAGLR